MNECRSNADRIPKNNKPKPQLLSEKCLHKQETDFHAYSLNDLSSDEYLPHIGAIIAVTIGIDLLPIKPFVQISCISVCSSVRRTINI